MGVIFIETTVKIRKLKTINLQMNFRELYRGYIRETIIKPGLQSTSHSTNVDHVSYLMI